MKKPRKSNYAKSKKKNGAIKEIPYIKKKYEKKYTNICTHCGVSYQSANPPRNGVCYCTNKHKIAHHRKGKLSDN